MGKRNGSWGRRPARLLAVAALTAPAGTALALIGSLPNAAGTPVPAPPPPATGGHVDAVIPIPVPFTGSAVTGSAAAGSAAAGSVSGLAGAGSSGTGSALGGSSLGLGGASLL